MTGPHVSHIQDILIDQLNLKKAAASRTLTELLDAVTESENQGAAVPPLIVKAAADTRRAKAEYREVELAIENPTSSSSQ